MASRVVRELTWGRRELAPWFLVDREEETARRPQVYAKLYKDFMEGLDAIDNGIEMADVTRYSEGTGLSSRVHRLNKRWNAPAGGPSEDELFEKASALCGTDFSDSLAHIVECELPARALVEEALVNRKAVHASGRVLKFTSGGCPWKTHLYELERKHNLGPLVKFVLYEDSSSMWRVQAVTEEGTLFTNRLGLMEPWRGLRDADLDAVTGIPGGKFIHASGFIGGHTTYDGALKFALTTIMAEGCVGSRRTRRGLGSELQRRLLLL